MGFPGLPGAPAPRRPPTLLRTQVRRATPSEAARPRKRSFTRSSLTPALSGIAKLCRQALLLRMQTSNVCIYYNPKPVRFSGSDGAAYLGLLLWSFGLLRFCPGARDLSWAELSEAFRSLPEAWPEVPGGLGPSGRLPGTFREPGGAPRIFFESLPVSEGEPARCLALHCDVFDERSQRLPRAPNLKPKEPRASAGPPALVSALTSSEILGK